MTETKKTKNRPTFGGLYIKSRDVRALRTLWQFAIMRESAIHQLCYSSIKHQHRLQARLKQLVDNDYIGRRFPPMVHPANRGRFTDYQHQHRRQPMYWIRRRGVEEIVNPGTPLSDEQRERLRRITKLSKRSEAYLNEPLDIADVRGCLELALASSQGEGLAKWYDHQDKDEHGTVLSAKVTIINPTTDKEKPFTLRQDGCLVLADTQSDRQDLFFLETDEGTESGVKRWADKVRAYDAYGVQGFRQDFEFRGEGFRVLAVVRSQAGAHQEQRKQNLLDRTVQTGGAGRYWFTTFDELLPNGIVTGDHILHGKIWQRARKEDREQNLRLALVDHLFDRDLVA